MEEKIGKIIKYISDSANNEYPLTKVNISGQFQIDKKDSAAIARNLNAAFLISLSGKSHPLYNNALLYLDDFKSHPSWEKYVLFYKEGIRLIHSEISNRCNDDERFKEDLDNLYSWISIPKNCKNQNKTIETIRKVFFPEGAFIYENRYEKIRALREKRKIKITKLNASPISDPAKELLFTSNILLTVPPYPKVVHNIPVSPNLKQMLKQIAQEEQLYWYDHPIPIGVAPEHNEVLYGLEGLDKAIEFEKQQKTIEKDARLTCVLSISVTHKGLQGIAKEYLEEEFKKGKSIKHLNIYVFTEADTKKIIENILIPASKKYSGSKEHSLLYEVVGVDGEYGRHYSFLKAIAAFWQIFIASEIKGTFKIDLDQVFPQKELVEQSGVSAFEHFKSPLWGAEGIDSQGNNIELGMIAGALVNQKDIKKSLFTPDVCFPQNQIKADELIFFSQLPQALSTEAEMMTRYTDNIFNGKNHCIQRIHVTGGTCGILIDSLRKYQPFTPTFISRAEDQAYILSVLFDGKQNKLRYVHKDGLIMRHDKEVSVKEAIKMATIGKLIGDYIRILMFSYYTRALLWPFERIKNEIDPFTGCFVSKIPLTVVYLRFALKMASFFIENTMENNQQGLEFFHTGIRRLHETIQKLNMEPDYLREQFNKEKQGWRMFYEILDRAETGIKNGDIFALNLQKKAKMIVENCKITFKSQNN